MSEQTTILDGRVVQKRRALILEQKIKQLPFTPTLVIVSLGNDARSATYISKKVAFGQMIGALVRVLNMKATTTEDEIITEIESLNQDKVVNGIIVQLPLPLHCSKRKVLDAIDPQKDVDGLHSLNLGKLLVDDSSGCVPATARGIMTLLDFYNIPLVSSEVVILGRSELVGKPVACVLLKKNASVTILHSQSRNIEKHIRDATIVISAVGKPHFLNSDMFGSKHVIVDVGTSLQENRGHRVLVGDIEFQKLVGVVRAVTPVPGGVGPMTVLSLFENLYDVSSRISV